MPYKSDIEGLKRNPTMKKQTIETRGRPRDVVYEGIAEDVKAHVAKFPKQPVREWVYDIANVAFKSPRARYLGFRSSTTYRELKAFLKAKGYTTSLFFDGTDVTLKVVRDGKDI